MSTSGLPACFKAYDIRGRVPEQLDADLARRIGAAFVAVLGARQVVVGCDVRLSSPGLVDALSEGIQSAGADVLDIGEGGTEHVYFAVPNLGADGGIMVTASHNPADYNGMKLVRAGSVPLSGDSGLFDIGRHAQAGLPVVATGGGRRRAVDVEQAYLQKLLSFIQPARLRPLKVVVDAGNGGAGRVVDGLEPHLPLRFVKLHHQPDGSFPNGVPNPLLPQNRAVTAAAVVEAGADFGVAWDGDFDRCFFFDHTGGFVEGYYLVGLLAERFLARSGPRKVIHDPRLTWNSIEQVQAAGGIPIQSKTGHAFIKERMRAEDACYGGEMSGHHYFRDFAYCDSGMIPWLLVAELLSESGASLRDLVAGRQARYPVSGEINRRVADAAATVAAIEREYAAAALVVEHVDGLSMEFPDWRFNLRSSNTEPLLRLNVETRADPALLAERTQALLRAIGGEAG